MFADVVWGCARGGQFPLMEGWASIESPHVSGWLPRVPGQRRGRATNSRARARWSQPPQSRLFGATVMSQELLVERFFETLVNGDRPAARAVVQETLNQGI